MPIEFVRIDDRLVHGQIATTWMRNLNIEQVIVVDDTVANDELQAAVIQLTAPPGVRIVLLTVDAFINAYKSGPIKRATMLIFTNPIDVLKTLEGGVEIPYLNVGGMKFKPGKKQLTKAVFVYEDDMNAFKKIIEKGVKVEIQMVPGDKCILLKDLLK